MVLRLPGSFAKCDSKLEVRVVDEATPMARRYGLPPLVLSRPLDDLALLAFAASATGRRLRKHVAVKTLTFQ